MRATSHRLLAPTVGTGVLMAVYLLARPYGDAGSDFEVALAFASTAWVIAHVAGALALASVGRLGLRLADRSDSVSARVARLSGLVGTVLVLPYYGVETFALHVIGRRALTEPGLLALADEMRNHPVAMTMFGIGLVLISAAGVAIGIAASRALPLRPAWSAWPLAIAIALFPAQYFVAPAGRIGFGVVYAVAAAVFAVAVVRSGDAAPTEGARVPIAMRG
ncbi:hypothetical protein [Pseudactinotalea suaedae]|uniref:hypothetical protein n=1 Tax=Pseudactinotalea suaedae TaxID=1524924 RepID=UPI0012E2364E|nr:hypothetical protein [Pseudactinotalea suaedae]